MVKTIGQLDTLTAITGTEYVAVNDGTDVSKKTDIDSIKTYIVPGTLGTLAYQDGTFSGTSSGTNTGDNATNTQYSGLASSKQDTLVNGTNIKTINSTSLLGSGNVAVQETLVSATNIKTINSTSLLGSGDIVISGGTDEKVKYDAGDPTAGYIADKIVAGTGISVAEGTGADENKLKITATGGGDLVLLADVSLTDPAATLSSGTITAKRLLYVSIYMSGRAAGEELVMLFNSDSGANYGYRFTPNGGSAVTGDGVNYIRFDAGFNAYGMSVQAFVNNLATFPKTCNFQSSEFSGTTLSNVCQGGGVWNNTSDSITSILIKTPSAVSLSAGTRMIIYGSKD